MRINYQVLSVTLILCIAFLLVNVNKSVSTEEAVFKNIYSRTSVRSYNSEKIPVETLKELIKAGMAAPTAGNMQPWEFLIIDKPETLEEMGSIHKFSAPAKGATAAIVVLANMDTYKKRPEFSPFWITDTSVATENILLAAHSIGLGAVWLSVYPSAERDEKLRAILNIPANRNILCFIALGHPKGKSVPKNKWKPEKVFIDTVNKSEK